MTAKNGKISKHFTLFQSAMIPMTEGEVISKSTVKRIKRDRRVTIMATVMVGGTDMCFI